MTLRRFFKEGEHFVWTTFAALVLCLSMVFGMVVLVASRGLGTFWPQTLWEITDADGTVYLAQRIDTEEDSDGRVVKEQVRIGARDVYGLDFKWLEVPAARVSERLPTDALEIERLTWGPVYGYAQEVVGEGSPITGGGRPAREALLAALPSAEQRRQGLSELEARIGVLNGDLEVIRRDGLVLAWEQGGQLTPAQQAELDTRSAPLKEQYAALEADLMSQREQDAAHRVKLRLAGGQELEMPISQVLRALPVNDLGLVEKLGVYLDRLGEFLLADPRESNTEGGVWPALFGTVMMTLIMTVFVVPLGILAAIYLKEYARQGLLVSLVRIAVNNLAGVPSIVFGVFGLGFFVYTLGGAVDQAFFAPFLPSPTFGTGGILWASLTLALLTMPVVIVSTEEALAAVPSSVREGAIGCGATQFQALWRVVLPSAAPGLLTGMILAVARGAGEVAPLMLTGVVKLAPALPIDATPPFIHLDRKFMHLGFHIYDVGFQSPNVEAAMPMVFSTALLLLLLVIALNLTAMTVRNHLREKYRTAAF